LGPFPTARIAELLKTREISVLDEIAPPLKRWQTLQYHDEFRDVVDSLRKASLSERTEATWTPSSTTNLTQTLTDVENGGELTQEVTDVDGFTNTAKEIVVHNVQEQTSAQAARNARFQPQYGQDTAIQRQVEKTTRSLWIVTGLILLAAAAFIVQKRLSSGSFELRPSISTLKQNVVNQVQIGHYQEALKDMKSYFSDPLQAGDLSIYYGALLIQVEGQTVMGRRLLNSVLSAHKPEAKQAYAGLGVADLIDGQLDSAKDNFDHALALDADYVPALVNMAAVHLQKGDYSQAKLAAIKALHASPLQGEALIMLAEAQLYLFKTNGNAAELAMVARMIHDYRAHQWDYAAELGFYSLYFDFLHRDHQLEEKVQSYLDIDPRLTQDHRHNVFIYKGRAQWKILARFCEQMSEQMGDGPRVSGLLASCLAHEQRWDAARSAIEKAVHQSPKDALIQAWYSYVLRESGDTDQAGVVLGRATDFNRRGDYVLPSLMQARFCQKNDLVECARENWQRIYERDLDTLPAVAGLAWVNAQQKSTAEAAKLLNRGLKISPDYIPLLELRQRAENEGWYVAN
jgi:tetratricopeptide (TPR) repeat protein